MKTIRDKLLTKKTMFSLAVALPLTIAMGLFIEKYNTCQNINSKTIAENSRSQNIKKIIKPITTSDKIIEGKFLRTYRWDKILDKYEEEYGIEKGLLKGLAMRESYGDPLRLSETMDGGAGLFMFQPGTARGYGLKVYGNSNKTKADSIHGKELKKIVEENNNDYGKLAKIDERFDVKKSSRATARYLKKLYKKHGSWNKALSAYNEGIPAKKPHLTNHVKTIREYQLYYNERDTIKIELN